MSLWVEKYRPKTVDEYVFHNEDQKAQVEEWIKNKSIPHLLFHGPPGTGKTTLAKVLINELDIDSFDVLVMNGSKEGRKIDEFYAKLEGFTQTLPFGEFKIVLVDEADFLNAQSVQPSLRNLMETYAGTCRFILTCNYIHKVIPALQDRCQVFKIEKQDHTEFTAKVAEVLLAEQVDFDIDMLDTYVKATYPSLRKALNLVQQNTIGGKLIQQDIAESTTEVKIKFVELLKANKFTEARKLISENTRPDEMDDMFVWMYNNLELWGDTDEQIDDAILIIRKAIVDLPSIPHADIHLAATVIELLRLRG